MHVDETKLPALESRTLVSLRYTINQLIKQRVQEQYSLFGTRGVIPSSTGYRKSTSSLNGSLLPYLTWVLTLDANITHMSSVVGVHRADS